MENVHNIRQKNDAHCNPVPAVGAQTSRPPPGPCSPEKDGALSPREGTVSEHEGAGGNTSR